MHRQTAHAILKNAFIEAGLNGHIATHSLRKSFAQRLYDKTGDIYMVQNYLDIGTSPRHRTLLSGSFRFLGGELKETADETLFLELALRGYDLSKLREDTETESPAEIVKIG